MAPTVEGAKRLVDTARQAGKIGQVGHMMRHADPVRVAWDLSHSEEFGEILSVESRYTTWPSATIPAGRGWGEPDEDWSYMLNQGGHPIDLMRHFLGPIVRVAGMRCHGKGSAKVYQVTVEGQTTAHYIADRAASTGARISRLAQGVPIGGELDYLDEGTLTAALKARREV